MKTYDFFCDRDVLDFENRIGYSIGADSDFLNYSYLNHLGTIVIS